MLKKIIFITAALLLAALGVSAQDTATIYGRVYLDDNSNDYFAVAISDKNTGITVSPNSQGYYQLKVPAGDTAYIVFYNFADRREFKINPLPKDGTYKLNVTLIATLVGKETELKFKRQRPQISIPTIIKSPTIGGNIESILATLPGVQQTNELSSQYNVRGGNFDENLIYVNGMEVFRPQLVRAGQQEGLSFINPAMVQSVHFSAGGFQAKYGDKLSSVLDVEYKRPDSLAGSILASFLGLEGHVEGTDRDLGWSRDSQIHFRYVLGVRYRSNGYILSTQDVQGSYNPRFYDVQSLLSYDFSKMSSLTWYVNAASNQYIVTPQSQETSFGTATNALQLFVGFAGRDGLSYSSLTNSLKYKHDGDRLSYNFLGAAYTIIESEEFDVEGAYRLSQLDNRLGSETFGQPIATLGTGYFINHGRNELVANIQSIAHRGSYKLVNADLEWGAKYQIESIDDKYREWRYEDSAGFNISPIDTVPDAIILSSFVSSQNTLNSHRWMGYVQNTDTFGEADSKNITYGVRANYWTVNDQWVYSPRVQYTHVLNKAYNEGIKTDKDLYTKYDSLKKKDITLKAAVGYYYQPPFYRELRGFDGQLNKDVKAQRSIHFVAGSEYEFDAFDRPFKFSSELYYKKLDYMIPYLVDNVRIRYFSDRLSKGYATGADFRLNGEFIEGLESWMSLSFLKTDEKIAYTNGAGQELETDYLRRPTDQRFSFSILFQDQLPSDSSYKVNLNLVYGSNVPYYLSQSERFVEGFEIPAYRRVDIGFSKEFVHQKATRQQLADKLITTEEKHHWAKGFKSVWLSLEIFNLFQINNTISYIWVKDLNNNTYGVPNYLTGRRINLKLLLSI